MAIVTTPVFPTIQEPKQLMLCEEGEMSMVRYGKEWNSYSRESAHQPNLGTRSKERNYLKGRKVRVYNILRQKFSRKLIFANFANLKKIHEICENLFRDISKTTKFAKFITKIHLYGTWITVGMHQCIKETFLQGFDYKLCLWRQIYGLKKIIFKSRNGIDREICES